MGGADIITFAYVLVENSVKLPETQYVFLRQLFQAILPGTSVIFMDSSPRLWPSISDLAYSDDDSGDPTFERTYAYAERARHVLVVRKLRDAKRDVRVQPV